MKTLLFWIVVLGGVYAAEVSRGMPDWCFGSPAQFNVCADIEFRSIYYQTGNPWPSLRAQLDNPFTAAALKGALR